MGCSGSSGFFFRQTPRTQTVVPRQHFLPHRRRFGHARFLARRFRAWRFRAAKTRPPTPCRFTRPSRQRSPHEPPISFARPAGRKGMAINPRARVVHLELHTSDLEEARQTYEELCGWHADRINVPSGSYTALELGAELGGGIVECRTRRPVWLPYVEVPSVAEATERARTMGAAILLEPREGPVGSRSVIATPTGAELAFWEPRRERHNGSPGRR